jgi:hypothetical protein
MPIDMDSSPSRRSAVAASKTRYTYYGHSVSGNGQLLYASADAGLAESSKSLPIITATERISSGVPVLTTSQTDKATGVTQFVIADIIDRKASDTGFYKVNGKDTWSSFKYINKPVHIPGTDGQEIYYPGYYVPVTAANAPSSTDSSDSTDQVQTTDSTKGFKWNLPPHKWSMPFMSSQSPMAIEDSKRGASSDSYRRGRIWSAYKANTYSLTTDPKTGKQTKTWNKAASDDKGWGFQFLWNPESLSTSVAVQMDATPNVNDQWLGAAGLFPATETFSINIRLDRTNDFARAGARFGRPTKVAKEDPGAGDYTRAVVYDDLVADYKVSSGFPKGKSEIIDDLKDLFKRGTLADLEYLFRAVNGKGPDDTTPWVNPRGIQTANIGWLQPNLVHIDVGPLSYLGWITNIQITHTSFTQDMIPMRTDVQMSFNTLATAGVGSKAADAGGFGTSNAVLADPPKPGTSAYANYTNTTGRTTTGHKVIPPNLLGVGG